MTKIKTKSSITNTDTGPVFTWYLISTKFCTIAHHYGECSTGNHLENGRDKKLSRWLNKPFVCHHLLLTDFDQSDQPTLCPVQTLTEVSWEKSKYIFPSRRAFSVSTNMFRNCCHCSNYLHGHFSLSSHLKPCLQLPVDGCQEMLIGPYQSWFLFKPLTWSLSTLTR